ncbi:hypothetical protein PR048_005627 [Dryococelus australis]|uniref:Mutator-like transposase domain-containing protein n=1 Tax=Dryococelus australis TaxID=614101 RepID=A0ABQ9I9P0_9NEOP|nr:hypothetical protein PR048_005627 [Dryococelus australis]
MARIKKFNPKRTFGDNQHTKEHNSNIGCSTSSADTVKVCPKKSSNSKILKHSKLPKGFDKTGVKFIVALEFLMKIALCSHNMNSSKVARLIVLFGCFSWQKRGHTSMTRVVTVTSFDTGKVLDFQCLSKFHTGCVHKKNGSSGGMEVAGATAIFARSENKLDVHYGQYLGDGDSKGFAAVLEEKKALWR